jgi:hypothetical protein
MVRTALCGLPAPLTRTDPNPARNNALLGRVRDSIRHRRDTAGGVSAVFPGVTCLTCRWSAGAGFSGVGVSSLKVTASLRYTHQRVAELAPTST